MGKQKAKPNNQVTNLVNEFDKSDPSSKITYASAPKIRNDKPSKMQELIKKLQIDETYTRPLPKPKLPKVKDSTYPKGGYNYMADLLMLPETKEGYKYILAVVDLWNNRFDIEPMKNKEAKTTLKALQTIFHRGKYIKEPKSSIRTDNGTEFKDAFDKWLYNNDILHSVSLPYRHKQTSNVESLNRQLGRLFNGYMNSMELKTKKPYKEWTDILDQVRAGLNEVRPYRKDEDTFTYNVKPIDISTPPKYNIGDLVYRRVERPQDILGQEQSTTNFRVGDRRFENVPRRIVNVVCYTSPNPYRYILEGFPQVSYGEEELLPAKEKEAKYIVRKIINKQTIKVNRKNQIQYLVWWKGYKKADATWEPKDILVEDDLQEYIDDYEDYVKKTGKTKR